MNHIFSPFQHAIEKALLENIPSNATLSKAVRYALTQGGKRLRPALVLMVAKALNPARDVMKAALSTEYFHTASLLADDLPCMDDDQSRRGKPSTHIVYGESTAILASYALIAAGYQAIVENARALNADSAGLLAIDNVSENAGLQGAAGGQHLDLYPPRINEETYIETAKKKTVALFEICFVLGWLFGGGDPSKLSLVKEAAYHYGMAFQIADDFDDAKQDTSNLHSMNAVSIWGLEGAKTHLHKHIESYFDCLKELNLASSELKEIAKILFKR